MTDQETNTNILYYIVFTIIGICYYGAYHDLPDESTNIDVPTIIDSCGGLAAMNSRNIGDSIDSGRWPLCDPNDIIDGEDKLDIVTKINQIEKYYDLRYGLGAVWGDTDTDASGTTNGSVPLTLFGNLKVTVFVIDEIGAIPLISSVQDKCEHIAYELQDSLEEDGSSNIVLLLTIKEEGICMTCSKELERIFTPSRIDSIMEELNSREWWQSSFEEVLVYGIDSCLKSIMQYLEEGEPSWFERYGWFLFCGGYLFFYFTSRNPRSRQAYANIQDIRDRVSGGSSNIVNEMNEEEQEEALSLMKRYQCFSCPICLEDYQESSAREDCEGGNNDDCKSVERIQHLGCDGEPIQLLRCGHSTCHGCWQEWMTTGRNSHICPVCKEDIGGR